MAAHARPGDHHPTITALRVDGAQTVSKDVQVIAPTILPPSVKT